MKTIVMKTGLVCWGMLMSVVAAFAGVPTTGFYYNEDETGIIKLKPCGRMICGTLIWGKDLQVGDTDISNPNPAKKFKPICGLTVLKFDRKGRQSWGYDPETGAVVKGFSVNSNASALILGGDDGERWPRASAPRVSCHVKEAEAKAPRSGYYYTQEKNAIVQLGRCGNSICGRLVWAEGLTPDVRGRKKQRLCGMTILKFDRHGKNAWAYDPVTGKTSNRFRVLDKGDYMSLGGAYGEVWRRTNKPTRACE